MSVKAAAPGAAKGSSSAADRPRVRDRILDTACDLFYKHGIRAVGVDAIANEAGTNKMSFYRSFPSKDDLVAEYLREQEHGYFEWWDATIAPHAGDPRAQLQALFDGYLGLSCAKAKASSRRARSVASVARFASAAARA